MLPKAKAERLLDAIQSAVGPGNRVKLAVPAKNSYENVRVEFVRLDIPPKPARFKAKLWRIELAQQMASLSKWITHKTAKGREHLAYLTISPEAIDDILKKSKGRG